MGNALKALHTNMSDIDLKRIVIFIVTLSLFSTLFYSFYSLLYFNLYCTNCSKHGIDVFHVFRYSVVVIWKYLPVSLYINPFVPDAPFLFPLKTSENLTVFWCFQGVEKGCTANEWVRDERIKILRGVFKTLSDI